MISAVIATLNDEARLQATLAALTAPAIDGFVREVIVADAGSTDATLAVAEEAGARIVTAGVAAALGEGCAAARQPWLLLLQAGTRPQAGWEQAAWRHVNDHSDRAGWFRLSLKAGGLQARALEARAAVEAGLLGRLRPEQGLLIPRRLLDEAREKRRGPLTLPLQLGRGALRPLGARILA
ncbi:MAG TPA: glycosyltransferase [Caulobacteraceae bacterium]|jgi:glycosyltransferase involved in cell wall biosynthesis|nr:glycosyltransferase [Caulobacteraceae bacterium]